MIVEVNISRGQRVIRKTGFGPAESLCLLMTRNDGRGVGLGDHIQSLPVIYNLIARGYALTIYAQEFFRPLYERAGCKFHSETELLLTNDLLPHYGEVYSMIEWSFDEHLATKGESQLDHTSLFASFFELPRPETFDFIAALGPKEDPQLRDLDTIIYAPESAFAWRTLSRQEQIYYKLKAHYSNVLWLGGIQAREKHHIADLATLVDLIYNASAVFTVDSGIMHLACALGVPMFGIFGGTDEVVLCEPYNFYLPEKMHLRNYFRALPSDMHGCKVPCWWQKARGFNVEGKCKEFADCMVEIDSNHLLTAFNNFYSTLHIRSN